MVRSEERSIYTPSENPTVQIYVGSSDADLETSDVNRKHCSKRVRSPRVQVSVGTPDKRRDFRRAQLNKQPAPLIPGLPAWVKSVSELPANVGTSNGRNFRRSSGLLTCTDSEQSEEPSMLGLLAWVGTSDCRDFRHTSGLPTVGSSDTRWDFRRPQSPCRL